MNFFKAGLPKEGVTFSFRVPPHQKMFFLHFKTIFSLPHLEADVGFDDLFDGVVLGFLARMKRTPRLRSRTSLTMRQPSEWRGSSVHGKKKATINLPPSSSIP